MSKEIILAGALANVHHQVSNDDLLEFLVENIPDSDFYKIKQSGIMGAALDWLAIISATASVITIATILWNAYKKFIKPLIKNNPKSNAGLFIQLKNENGDSIQFMIDKKYKNREIFLNEFIESYKQIIVCPTKKGIASSIKEIRNSKRWIKIK